MRHERVLLLTVEYCGHVLRYLDVVLVYVD